MAEQSVTLQPGESKVVSFEATPHEARSYQVSPEEGPPLPRGLELRWPWKKD
ncbi:unnamed protein product [marine sediment metagenome]|uniref:Uncharacterized protein n=1 Tax=marine sediment metagenome TaxID=412755 RepID=X1PYC0_9ZZZZ